MNSNVFINEAVDFAIRDFLNNGHNPHSIKYSTFPILVIRTLILIYGEVDIINPFKTANEKGMGGFDVNLGKFGYPLKEINKFKEDFLNYYLNDKTINERVVKTKNIYLTEVEKDMIDMFFCKMKSVKVDDSEVNEFYSLLYTMDSKNTFIKSYNLLYAVDVNEVKHYYDFNMFQLNNPLTFKAIIINRLDFAIYNHFGISNDVVLSWNQEQVNSVNEQIFDYVQTSLDDPNLLNKMNHLLASRRKPKIHIVY